jgi:hypothetical protein
MKALFKFNPERFVFELFRGGPCTVFIGILLVACVHALGNGPWIGSNDSKEE